MTPEHFLAAAVRVLCGLSLACALVASLAPAPAGLLTASAVLAALTAIAAGLHVALAHRDRPSSRP